MRELFLKNQAFGVAFTLGATVRVEYGPQRGDIVGQHAGTGVAYGRGDGLGLAGNVGLPSQRGELAPNLAGEIAKSGQVGLHRVELAQRLLLAPAVLENAGGLLDEATPFLGTRAQHRIQLTLPDDDVHLAAEAGVAE